jgi:hypothetical protein
VIISRSITTNDHNDITTNNDHHAIYTRFPGPDTLPYLPSPFLHITSMCSTPLRSHTHQPTSVYPRLGHPLRPTPSSIPATLLRTHGLSPFSNILLPHPTFSTPLSRRRHQHGAFCTIPIDSGRTVAFCFSLSLRSMRRGWRIATGSIGARRKGGNIDSGWAVAFAFISSVLDERGEWRMGRSWRLE